ncbi:MAG TPA: DNA ligase D [Acetobacteraceae bacterium]|jgi:bifunctional non-homologous end joining protein LigD|nr:DNA ligase D [Acetobacteraceae bacterium]
MPAAPERRPGAARDTSIRTYRTKRDFTKTREPAPSKQQVAKTGSLFVVQKHQAHRAGLHWDFRLEHDGVLWSWAVRKGPSLDPADKRIAVHVEDHPLDYANFEGSIPEGQYGAGDVQLWDRGTWQPLGDPEAGMRDGEIKFVLDGQRLHGKFTLVRLKPRAGQRSRQDNWLLIKGHDDAERKGADATAIEADAPAPRARDEAPAEGAKRARLPQRVAPELASVTEEPPTATGWISEIKFDGYRLLCWKDGGKARVITRNGLDWTDRLPAVARAIARLNAQSALVDGELVALDKNGASSFPALQAALSAGKDETLHLYLFDLLYLDGWDLRPCVLTERKRVLQGLSDWRGFLRYSDHHDGDATKMLQQACQMGLEGIVCKQAQSSYRSGRGHDWLKVKCRGREEFVVLGWTPPGGSRAGLGSLHLGYYDARGGLHYAGGVGSGFSDDELARISAALEKLAAAPPKSLLAAGDPLPKDIHWVKPDLVAEVQFTSWSGSGRVRQAVYLGLRQDKAASEVVREPADKEADRKTVHPHPPVGDASKRPVIAVPPRRDAPKHSAGNGRTGSVVTARAPAKRGITVGGVSLSHPDRELWPNITKQDLAEYWAAIADHALPGLAGRPLAIVRCPEGIGGEHFFQKHGRGALPSSVRQGEAGGQPYLAIDDADGLIAMAQISAIELHAWGAGEADPLHPDQLVFDLDPGEGVSFADVVKAARDVREQLQRVGLESFCRTTGGKGLHVVVPLRPVADWDQVKPFCRAFAETLSEAEPTRFLSTVKKLDRKGRILIDWLRNGLGATAVASFCPRARPGAAVAMPLSWDDVNAKLDPTAFTLRNTPQHLARQARDPWGGFDDARRPLPDMKQDTSKRSDAAPRKGSAVIVTATKPKRR